MRSTRYHVSTFLRCTPFRRFSPTHEAVCSPFGSFSEGVSAPPVRRRFPAASPPLSPFPLFHYSPESREPRFPTRSEACDTRSRCYNRGSRIAAAHNNSNTPRFADWRPFHPGAIEELRSNSPDCSLAAREA